MGFWKNVLLTAGLATAGTTVAASLLGRKDAGSAAAALNATSHILYGERAARQDEFSLKYTLAGSVLNAAAMLSWAALQELGLGRWARGGSTTRAAMAGAATSGVAYITDYRVVPERLTPGFEKRLSRTSLAIVYSVLALALAVGVRAGDRWRG